MDFWKFRSFFDPQISENHGKNYLPVQIADLPGLRMKLQLWASQYVFNHVDRIYLGGKSVTLGRRKSGFSKNPENPKKFYFLIRDGRISMKMLP